MLVSRRLRGRLSPMSKEGNTKKGTRLGRNPGLAPISFSTLVTRFWHDLHVFSRSRCSVNLVVDVLDFYTNT